MESVKKGDILWFVTDKCQGQCYVKSIGRKYITIASGAFLRDIRFHVDTWKQKDVIGLPYVLYQSEKEWKDEQEHNKYARAFWRRELQGWRNKCTLEQLREAAEILGIQVEVEE